MKDQSVIGAVAIGRNEGERLERCLRSLSEDLDWIVYVDSGSTDGSPELAKEMNVTVVELDMSEPFTAARARNAGLAALLAEHPVKYVQFIDGDCELSPRWLERAFEFMEADPAVAVVCGRRRERFPDMSAFNRICDQEWDTPVGEAAACGGDSMMRISALNDVGTFNSSLIAGEEPELCLRFRRAGWKIYRVDDEMTLHDAAITHFSQFAKRMVRSGWAYAEGADRYGGGPERYNVREVLRIWFWAGLIPIFIVSCTLTGFIFDIDLFYIIAVLGALSYPFSVLRMALNRRRNFDDSWPNSLRYGIFLSLTRPWQLLGILQYRRHKAKGGVAEIIEYKDGPQGRSF